MGKKGGKKLQAFCVNRIRPIVKGPLQNKLGSPNYIKKTDQNEGNEKQSSDKLVDESHEAEKLMVVGRKIMVVVDSSAEAGVALQWTLTHTVQSHDVIVLLYVTKVSKNQGKQEGVKNVCRVTSKAYEQLYSMKKTCQSRWPEVKVEVKIIEGKEKGPRIVEEARKQEVSLLVLGQKKRSATWQLLLMWAGSKAAGGSGVGLVEYCIQNATCMALGVRRKSKKIGGYLITTKRQKDFWLLA